MPDKARTPLVAVTVPPQVFPRLTGVANDIPAGRVSLTATPVSVEAPFGFVRARVRVTAEENMVEPEENDLVRVGAANPLIEADAVVPVPDSLEVIAPVTFVLEPEVVTMMLTLTWQDADVAKLTPDKERTPLLAVAVPPQVLFRLAGVAKDIPAGNVSLTATPVKATPALGFVIARVIAIGEDSPAELEAKDLVIVGGATPVIDALAVAPAPDSVAVIVPVVFVFAPADVTITSTLTWQAARLVNDPPDKDSTPPVAVAVPPQVLLRLAGVAKDIPVGSVSLTATPDSAEPLGLEMLSVRDVGVFRGVVADPNALVISGGAIVIVPTRVAAAGAILVPPFLMK